MEISQRRRSQSPLQPPSMAYRYAIHPYTHILTRTYLAQNGAAVKSFVSHIYMHKPLNYSQDRVPQWYHTRTYVHVQGPDPEGSSLYLCVSRFKLNHPILINPLINACSDVLSTPHLDASLHPIAGEYLGTFVP